MRLLIILSLLFSPLSFAGHHSESKNEQIIFLLDLEVIEGKENQVDDLIDRLVENVKRPNQERLHMNIMLPLRIEIFLYEVYENHSAAEFHVDSFLQGDLMPIFADKHLES